MYSDYATPNELQFVGTTSIADVDSISGIDCPLTQLNAIAFADFGVIYQALINGHELSYWQQYAVKRIQYDKSGRLIGLALRDKLKALQTLSKYMGWI